MDSSQFDQLARVLGERRNRRQAVVALTGTAVGLALATRSAAATISCELYCPENIETFTDPGLCTAAVVVPGASINGYCGENPVIDCDHPLDDDFPIGATTILCNVTGYVAPCTVTVIVDDNSNLIVTCPADIAEESDGPAAVSFDPAFVSTACGSGHSGANCDHASGDVFPLGTTTVTCSIPQGAGGLPETCTFDVTLAPAPATATATNTPTEDPANPTATPTDAPATTAPTTIPGDPTATEVPATIAPTTVPGDPTATTAPVTELPNTGTGDGGSGTVTRLLPVAIGGAGLALLTRLGLRQRPAQAKAPIDE